MKNSKKKLDLNDKPLNDSKFLRNYNENMPTGYPLASLVLLRKFKSEHPSLFKGTSLWSINQHRKRLIDWLQQNA